LFCDEISLPDKYLFALATIFSLVLAIRPKIQQLRLFSSGQLAMGTFAMVWVLYQSRRTIAAFFAQQPKEGL